MFQEHGAATNPAETRYLMRFLWLSVALSLVTMAIKGYAAYLTGSVGILSDADRKSVV